MSEFIANLVSSAVSSLFFRCLQQHERCYYGEQCLWPANASKCEQTMRLCCEAQIQLGTPYLAGGHEQRHVVRGVSLPCIDV